MHMCMLEAGRAVAQHDATQLERASADDVARRFWLLCDSGVACERCGLELRHRGAAYVVDDHERRSGLRRRPPHADVVLALLQRELEQAQRLRLQRLEASAVGLEVAEPIADAVHVRVARVSLHVLQRECAACALAHAEQVVNELEQRPSGGEQALSLVGLALVCADAGDGRLTVRVYVEGAGGGEHGECASDGLQLCRVDSSSGCDAASEECSAASVRGPGCAASSSSFAGTRAKLSCSQRSPTVTAHEDEGTGVLLSCEPSV